MTDLIGSLGPVFVVSAAAFGPLSGWFAGRRDRHPVLWLGFGALLGPLAMLLLSVAPPGRCSMCDTPVRGWASICAVCGAPLTNAAGAGRYQARETSPVGPVTPVVEMEAGGSFGSPDSRLPPAPVFTMLAPHRLDDSHMPDGPSRPIRLPVERSATPRIRRPDFADRPARNVTRASYDGGQDAVAVVLATGVYFGGTAGLSVGGRYVITREGALFRMLGPVDLDPTRVALERPLARLAAVAVGERLVITEGNGSRVSLAIGLGALAGMDGPALELALAPPDGSTADRQPASG